MNNLLSPFEDGQLDCARECDNVPHLAERMVVDLVNGLDASADHLRFKQTRGPGSRILGWLSGSSRRRELLIQEQHQESLEVLVDWVVELTEHGSHTMRTMTRVAERCHEIGNNLARFTGQVTAEFRRQRMLIERLQKALDQRCSVLEFRVARLEGHKRINEFMEDWKAGRFYQGYPELVQAVLAIDDLCRGEEGERIFGDTENRKFLESRVINRLNEGLDLHKTWLPLTKWSRLGIKPFAPARTVVAEYLLAPNGNKNLHAALGTFALQQRMPEWLEEEQVGGRLQRFYGTEGLVKTITKEAESRDAYRGEVHESCNA